MRKRLDLSGQRYGKLTVLHPAENIGACTAWLCRCDCGQETVVRTDNLRNGRTKSCGCQRGANPLSLGTALADGSRVEKVKTECVKKNNTSGVSGVEWLPLKKRWKSTICYKGRRYYLGTYRIFEDAVKARKRAENARKCAEENACDRFLREYVNAQLPIAGSMQKQNAG